MKKVKFSYTNDESKVKEAGGYTEVRTFFNEDTGTLVFLLPSGFTIEEQIEK